MDCRYSPADLLPHAAPMILVDRVLDWSADGARAAVRVGPATPFLDPGRGVPVHVGLEWMAQTCGLFAGLEAREQNAPIRLGFLLGTRRYQADLDYFAEGASFEIEVRLLLREGGMAQFDCRILAADGHEAATARLSVYQPQDADGVPPNRSDG